MENEKKLFEQPVFKVIFFTFLGGMAIHLFSLTNVLHNYDNVAAQPGGYGTGVTSGRWALTLIGELVKKAWGNYNLPYFNGALLVLFLALSAGILFSVFQMKSWKTGLMAGLLLMSFPAAVSIMFFKFCAGYYGLAVFLSVLAPWFIEKWKYGIFPAAACIAVALGIYQAYLPLTISLMILLLIRKALEKETGFVPLFKKGVYDCCTLILGLVFYYIGLKACLSYYGLALSGYQGISEMGQIHLNQLPAMVWNAMTTFVKLPVADYCAIAPTGILKMGYFLLGILCMAWILWLIAVKKIKMGNVWMLIILGALFTVGVNFIMIMCPNSEIYTLMVLPFVVILFVPLVLSDISETEAGSRKLYPLLKRTVYLILAVMLCNYVYLANVNYTAMYYTTCQTENYVNSMVAQIRMTEGFDTSKKWAFIGRNIKDPLRRNPWENIPFYGGNKKSYLNYYSREDWIENYVGYRMPLADGDTISELQNLEEVKNMPCWPDNGSVKTVGENIVIKLQEIP